MTLLIFFYDQIIKYISLGFSPIGLYKQQVIKTLLEKSMRHRKCLSAFFSSQVNWFYSLLVYTRILSCNIQLILLNYLHFFSVCIWFSVSFGNWAKKFIGVFFSILSLFHFHLHMITDINVNSLVIPKKKQPKTEKVNCKGNTPEKNQYFEEFEGK